MVDWSREVNMKQEEKIGKQLNIVQSSSSLLNCGSRPNLRHYQAWRHTEVAADIEAGG
jgi:hypothetical protein